MKGGKAVEHGDWAWAAIAATVLTYEVMAPEGQLLSEAVDKYRRRHPAVTNGVVLLVALHLLRALPARWDPIHQLAVRMR